MRTLPKCPMWHLKVPFEYQKEGYDKPILTLEKRSLLRAINDIIQLIFQKKKDIIQIERVNLRDGTVVPFDTFVSPNSWSLYISVICL